MQRFKFNASSVRLVLTSFIGRVVNVVCHTSCASKLICCLRIVLKLTVRVRVLVAVRTQVRTTPGPPRPVPCARCGRRQRWKLALMPLLRQNVYLGRILAATYRPKTCPHSGKDKRRYQQRRGGKERISITAETFRAGMRRIRQKGFKKSELVVGQKIGNDATRVSLVPTVRAALVQIIEIF